MVEKSSNQNSDKQKLNMQDVLSMRSSGYYSQRTAGAKNAIDSVLPLMKTAVNNLPETEVFRFADFGAADGGTSAELWAKLISSLRGSGDERHIELLYTDLPSNDFSTLFKTMQGMHGDTSNAFLKWNTQIVKKRAGEIFDPPSNIPKNISINIIRRNF